MEKIFERATRNKLRFQFRGMASVEDLWDLSLTDLDQLYKVINKDKKSSENQGLLEVKTKASAELDDKLSIIKHIFETKQAEMVARENAIKTKQQKDFLLGVLDKKKNEEILEKSPEEIQEMIDKLS